MATYAPGDPNTPSHLRTKATGWIGSKYVGAPAPSPMGPSPTAPSAPVSAPQVQPGRTLQPSTTLAPSPSPAGSPRPIEGFDAAKFADPALGTSHKYVGGRIAASGGTAGQILADPKFAGWTKVSEDKVRSPEGSVYDFARDVGGANAAQWMYVGGGPRGVRNDGIIGNDPNSANYTKPGGLGYKGPPVPGTPAMPTAPAIPQAPAAGGDPVQDAFRAQLLKILGQTGGAITTDDPNINPQAVAYRRARERGAERERAQAAERAAFMGLNSGGQGSGAFETDIQGIREGAGEDIAGYEAGLVGQEVQARRQQLMQGLELANAVGARTEALALQRQLADLDNKYRYASLGQQQGQFEDRTAYDYAQLEAEMNRQALLAGLG